MEIRKITSEMNILTRSDGSALLTQGMTIEIIRDDNELNSFLGNSAVCVNVNGPLEVFSNSNMDMNKAYIDVNYRPKRGLPGVGERYKERILKNVCDTAIITSLYPKTQINIQLQEMDDNGGVS
jgi:exosome complex component RRP46